MAGAFLKMTVEIDREHHLTSADLAVLRGPFVSRPADASPFEWLRWAREIDASAALARSIVVAADQKAAKGASR